MSDKKKSSRKPTNQKGKKEYLQTATSQSPSDASQIGKLFMSLFCVFFSAYFFFIFIFLLNILL